MACHIFGTKPLPEPMMAYCELDSGNECNGNSIQNSIIFLQEYVFENVMCQNGSHFVQEEMS